MIPDSPDQHRSHQYGPLAKMQNDSITRASKLVRAVRKRLTTRATQRLMRKGFWGIADHGLVSLTNFITMVLVARVVSPAEFGMYSLAYTVLLFVNSLQSALIVQPHAVLGVRRAKEEYIGYTTDTGWLQVAFTIIASSIILAIAVIGFRLEWWVGPMLLALAPAAAAWQLQHFVRRVMYTTSRISGAFMNDLISYGGQIVGMVVLWQVDLVTPVTAILTLAATSACAFLVGLWQIRSDLDWTFTPTRIKATLDENWSFGKWLLGGHIAFWTSGQVYPLLAAGLVSVTATGIMRAAQTIIGPTNVLMSSIDPVFGPTASRTYASQGLPALRRILSRLHLLILSTVGMYCIAVAAFAEQIFDVIYGPEYGQYGWVLIVVALTTLVSSLRMPIKIGLKALLQTNAIFQTYLASSAVNLTLGLAIVHLFGFKGVALGLILNSIVIQVMLTRFQKQFLYDGERPSLPRVFRLPFPMKTARHEHS